MQLIDLADPNFVPELPDLDRRLPSLRQSLAARNPFRKGNKLALLAAAGCALMAVGAFGPWFELVERGSCFLGCSADEPAGTYYLRGPEAVIFAVLFGAFALAAILVQGRGRWFAVLFAMLLGVWMDLRADWDATFNFHLFSHTEVQTHLSGYWLALGGFAISAGAGFLHIVLRPARQIPAAN